MSEQRVSLIEKYNNKDVITQIALLKDQSNQTTDTAEGAVNTANSALKTITKEGGLKDQVETAVTNANKASADAESAVATAKTYDERLYLIDGKDKPEGTATTTSLIAQLRALIEQADAQITQLEAYTIKGNLGTDAHQSMQGGLEADELSASQINVYDEANIGDLSVTGTATIPDTTTGTKDSQAVNGTRLQNDLDNYGPMMRLGETQVDSGNKIFTGGSVHLRMGNSYSPKPSGWVENTRELIKDKDERILWQLRPGRGPTNQLLDIRTFFFNPSDETKQKFCSIRLEVNNVTGVCGLSVLDTKGVLHTILSWTDTDLINPSE